MKLEIKRQGLSTILSFGAWLALSPCVALAAGAPAPAPASAPASADAEGEGEGARRLARNGQFSAEPVEKSVKELMEGGLTSPP